MSHIPTGAKVPADDDQTLRADAEIRLIRRRDPTGGPPCLLVCPASQRSEATVRQRLQHEFALRDSLDPAWAAVPCGIEAGAEALPALRLHDPGGEPLERLLHTPWEVEPALRVARAIAGCLRELHARGLLHNDLHPGHVLVDVASARAWLTGFGAACAFTRAHPDADGGVLPGALLTHASPERTGWMRRGVDARSDLYALGVLLHQMLTAALPFDAAHPMELIHAHLARPAPAPSQRRAGLPSMLDRVVLKLLAKAAEDRYQSAAGIEADLERCLRDWQAGRAITPFKPAERDFRGELRVGERLVGRERERDTLRNAHARVATTGRSELVLVAGYAGIGKTSLVAELQRLPAVAPHPWAVGKADQTQRGTPLAAPAQALQALAQALLARPADELAAWRKRLQEAAGPCGQVLLDLAPGLAPLIGPQPPLPALPPRDTQARLHRAFRRFLQALGRPGQPLLLFLDDLQWVDPATLELLASLFDDEPVAHLLLVGACRNNEVGPQHPLQEWIAARRRGSTPVTELVLSPLSAQDVGLLVGDALPCRAAATGALAQVVYEATGGNPFFVAQWLATLCEEGLLAFDPGRAAWHWDLDAIRTRARTGGVHAFMADRITRLPSAARAVLRPLACLGITAPAATLARACGRSEAQIDAALWPAVNAGLVLRLATAYRFVHDRVQEAAYGLIEPARRPAQHLRIARRLDPRRGAGSGMEHGGDAGAALFELVNQYNLAGARAAGSSESAHVAALNLQAARQAMAAAAPASALDYLHAGIQRLGAGAFTRRQALAFELHLAHAECEFLLGRINAARAALQTLLPRAAGPLQLAAACRQLVALHVVRSDYARGVEVALQGLQRLGVTLQAHPPRAQVKATCDEVLRRLDAQPAGALCRLAPAHDPGVEAALIVLGELFAPACFTDEGLALLHLCRMVELTLEHGLTPASTHGLAWFGIMIGHHYGRHAEGLALAEQAHALVRRHGFAACEAKTLFALEIASVWARPLAQAIATSRATLRAGSERGDLGVACFACNHTVNDMLVRGDPLDDVAREIDDGLAFVRRAQFRDVLDELRTQQAFVRALRGGNPRLERLDGGDFGEAAFEATFTAERMPTMIFWYWVFKGQLRFIAGQPREALQALEQARAWLWSSPVHVQLLHYHLFSALAVAAVAGDAAARQARLREHLARLHRWRDAMPATFADKAVLVEAELARLEGREGDAARGYEAAAALAREQGCMLVEALAHELAWSFHAARGLATAAAAYLRQARHAWVRWGAAGKVAQLDRLHSWLQEADAAMQPPRTPAPAQLDMATVIRVSAAVTAESDPERLIDTLMTLALEHAGAERAVLLLQHGDGALRVEAQAAGLGPRIDVRRPGGVPTAHTLPLTVLEAALQARRSVLLDDAAAAPAYALDPYVQRHRPRSVLCLPLLRREGLAGALYLENNLAPGAFPAERLAVLELLASQAAISLHQARLLGELVRENRERQAAELESERARTALEESEGRFRRMADATPDVIWITELEPERVLYASPSFERIWGASVQALYEDPRLWTESIHEQDRDRIQATFGQWLEAAAADAACPWEAEYRIVQPGGAVRWIHERGFVICDAQGRPQRVSGISSDVTERHRAAQALHESEQRFALAVAGANDGIWDWDITSDRVFLSERAQRLYGLDPGETTRPRTQWRALMHIHPEDYERHRELLAAHLAQRAPVYDGEWRVLHADGQFRWVRTRGLCVRDAAGRPARMAGSVSDVDAQKHAEAALLQAQRLEAMGSLAGGIAHDFNNILSAILGYGEMALRHARAGSRLRHQLDCIVTAGERGRALVERILAFSRSGVSERVPVNAEAAIREALALLAGKLPTLVRVEAALDTGAAAVLGDPTQLHQVLMNLATNAVQAMPQGGRLRVTLSPATVATPRLATTATLRPGDYVVLAVADEGVGIAPEIRGRIFDPFFTTKDVGTGTGLGLSLVHGIVAALGGAVDVATAPGAGSTFTVYLPRNGEAVATAPALPAPLRDPLPQGAGQRVMVVDDEAALVQLATETLSALGYEPQGFTSGTQALAAFQADPQRFDVLVTDERMPHFSGTLLIEAVRRLRPALPILLVSGYASEAAAAGADAVLSKPLRRQALAAALARLLRCEAAPAAPIRRPRRPRSPRA